MTHEAGPRPGTRSAPPVAVQQRDDPAGLLSVHSVHWPGPGPVVVLIHGMVVAGRSMFRLAGVLAACGCDVWVPDVPGFGVSDKPPRALDVDEMADVLAEWMEGVDIGDATAIGNSFGTQAAAALVERHPDRIARLVLVGPTIDERLRKWVPRSWLRPRHPGGPSAESLTDRRGPLRRAVQQLLAAPRAPIGQSTPSLRSLILTEYLSAGARRVLATYRYAISDRIEGRLAGIAVPTLVVRGEGDGLISVAWARRLAEAVADGEFVEAAGAGHDACYDSPRKIAELVLGCPQGLPARGGAGGGAP